MTVLVMINDASLINADNVVWKTEDTYKKSYNKAIGLHLHQDLNSTQQRKVFCKTEG